MAEGDNKSANLLVSGDIFVINAFLNLQLLLQSAISLSLYVLYFIVVSDTFRTLFAWAICGVM